MGNFIFAGYFPLDTDSIQNPGLTAVSSRTLASGFDDANILSLTRMKKRFRANDLTKTDWLLKFYFPGSQALTAIVLDDVNFDKVTIQGHATDSWGAPSFTTTVSISRDNRVQRYKAYIPLTSFNYAYLRIYIPTDATAVGTYTTKWEVGRVACLASPTTLSVNPAEYRWTAPKARKLVELPDGPTSVVQLSDSHRFEATLTFSNALDSTALADLETLNELDSAQALVFYENGTDTSKVYICYKANDIEVTRVSGYGDGIVTGNTLKLVEYI